MHRLVTLLGILATFGTAAACNPSPAAPELTNPREIVSQTIAATASLSSMRVRVDLEVRDPARPGVPQGGAAEGVLDLTAGEMSVTGAALDGTGAFALIQADGAFFTRTADSARWMKVPAMNGGLLAMFMVGGGGAGQQPDVRVVLSDLLDDAETTVELKGVEDCATGRCYVTVVGLPPAQVWKLVVGISGIDRMQGAPQPMEQPQGIPGLALQVVTDTATLRLVELAGSVSVEASTAAVRLRVAAPNEPVAINAPPPALVDNPRDNIGGGGFVGPPVAVPVQPVPQESIGP